MACTGTALPLLSHLKLRLYDNEVFCAVRIAIMNIVEFPCCKVL